MLDFSYCVISQSLKENLWSATVNPTLSHLLRHPHTGNTVSVESMNTLGKLKLQSMNNALLFKKNQCSASFHMMCNRDVSFPTSVFQCSCFVTCLLVLVLQ